ncbi:MAG TPA: hypothetical protein VK611_08685 [Acidimicrobiales bacterium]|nr:hypothetical protein [Acidimicrobiales bacterium]
MIDWISGKILEVTALVRGASVLGAIVMVAFAYYKARSLVAVLVAALTAGVFLWSISNLDWWEDKVEEESDTMGRLGVTVETFELVQPAGATIVL